MISELWASEHLSGSKDLGIIKQTEFTDVERDQRFSQLQLLWVLGGLHTETYWVLCMWGTAQSTIVLRLLSYSLQFSSVTQSYPTLCTPMDCSTPGFPVHHQLPELAQTHVLWVSDAIQLSHPLLSPSPPAFNVSQNQGLFQWVSFSHQVAKVLEFQLQYQSFQWIFKTDFLQDWLVWFPCSPRGSQESSPTPQFKSVNSS